MCTVISPERILIGQYKQRIELTCNFIFVYYSIIWYERFGSPFNRTFINRLASRLGWCAIEWFLAIQLTDTIRFLFIFSLTIMVKFCNKKKKKKMLFYLFIHCFFSVSIFSTHTLCYYFRHQLQIQWKPLNVITVMFYGNFFNSSL
jgi:hypothetical protein